MKATAAKITRRKVGAWCKSSPEFRDDHDPDSLRWYMLPTLEAEVVKIGAEASDIDAGSVQVRFVTDMFDPSKVMLTATAYCWLTESQAEQVDAQIAERFGQELDS